MDMLRRAYRCISSGAIPATNQQSASGRSAPVAPAAAADGPDDASYYHSYSCDDLYLAADDADPRGAGQLPEQPDAAPEVPFRAPEEVPCPVDSLLVPKRPCARRCGPHSQQAPKEAPQIRSVCGRDLVRGDVITRLEINATSA